MSGDYSRIAFDPWLDDLGVLLEQGRPLTDRDWNDQALQLNRRIQAGTLDTVGAAVVPIETPSGFEILLSGGNLTIGRGRMYVHGLLAENHGKAPDGSSLSWDPKLAELFGTAGLDYAEQPYFPNPPALPTGGRHVAYLDVWQREVTRFIRPDLVEKALGIDTTTRLQTVWQVKLLRANADTNCGTPLEHLEGWLPAHAPSAGRLSVTTVPVPGQPDPCQLPLSGGYKGLENQLYRVEIHTGGEPGTATFKWSRDNASVEAVVIEIPSPTQIVVDSVGKDDVLGFASGDWIEITDDWLELHGQPGLLRRIATNNGVDPATRTITLDAALPAGQFPTNPQDVPDPGRHTRIRRWDQQHTIVDAAGDEVQDLDDALSDGTITVPAGATQILLEHNIVVSFSAEPAGGEFRSGDCWMFAARNSDASVEELVAAPPRSIHHHYAKLAVVTFPNSEIDCRVFWPPAMSAPPAGEPAEECGCTVCVTPQSHNSGAMSIQDAIDEVVARGGGTVCLDVGSYPIQQPLQIADAKSLRIVGKGPASEVQGTTRIATIGKSYDVTLEAFAITCRPAGTAGGPAAAADAAVVIASSADVRIERMAINIENNNPAWAAVGLSGALVNLRVQDCKISGATGIRSEDANGGETGLTDLRVEQNAFECVRAGLQLGGITIHQFISHIRGNRFTGCEKAGIVMEGGTVPGHGVEIAANAMVVRGDGIVAGLNGLRVLDNDIQLAKDAAPKEQTGIRLLPTVTDKDVLDDIRVAGNRISGFPGAGIDGGVRVARQWTFAGNSIDRSGHGILLKGLEQLHQVAIQNNRLAEVQGFGILAEATIATLMVAGNQIATGGRDSAVRMVFTRGDCTFSDNQIVREGEGGSPTVLLTSSTLVVDANRVMPGKGTSMELKSDGERYTVLGNICSGIILMNGPELDGPWKPLNRKNV